MILVTGATSAFGREAVRLLAEETMAVRALVHSKEKLGGVQAPGVEGVLGDLADRASLRPALAGVEKVFLICPRSPALPELEKNLIDEAKDAGVRHVVKVSVSIADLPDLALAAWHRQSEQYLAASSLQWTLVRSTPGMPFVRAWAERIRATGKLRAPAADGRAAFVHPLDVPAAAVRVLLGGDHASRTYTVTGPEALSFGRIAEAIGAATGHSVSYEPISGEAYQQELGGKGPASYFFDLVRGNHMANVSTAVRDLTGKPARSIDAWLQENAAAFR